MANIFERSAQQALTPFGDRMNAYQQQALQNQRLQQQQEFAKQKYVDMLEQQELDNAYRMQQQQLDENFRRQQLAVQRASVANSAASAARLPAPLQLANEYRDALERGDVDYANQIAAFAKIHDKGVAYTPAGFGVQPGYDEALGQLAQERSRGTAFGSEEGEAQASLSSQASKMPELMQTMDNLRDLAEDATYTQAGQLKDALVRQLGLTTPGALARTEYKAIVDNQVLPLLRDTFGAAFTQAEGDSMRATLGDPDKSPMEKYAIIDAFIEQKQRNIQSLQRQMRQPVGLFERGRNAFNAKKSRNKTVKFEDLTR